MHEELIIAGFGGQGVLSIGQLVAYAALAEDKHVLWMPAYGPETRGGFANCTVMVSDSELYSPISERPSSVIVMNLPSLDKFERSVAEDGLIVVNKSLVNRDVFRGDIDKIVIPATEMATELGNVKAANMVALGAYLAKKGTVSIDTVKGLFPKVFKGKEKIIPLNEKALDAGAGFVASLM